MLHVLNSDLELRQRVSLLEEENRQLRRFMGMEPNHRFARAAKDAFGTSRSQARLLQVLVTGQVRNNHALMSAYAGGGDYPSIECLKVQIYRLRDKLTPHGIAIRNDHGVGYSMSDDDRAKACELLEAASL